MPNAKDLSLDSQHKILAYGPTGSGKTTQFLTLPGKKFAYLFDPNAKLSLRGYDLEYEEFLPENVNLEVRSLTKGTGDKGSSTSGSSEVYLDWTRDYEEKKRSGFWKTCDWLMMDSITTFLDLIMDRVLTVNGRAGQWPQQDDYGPQMLAFTKVVRELASNNIGLYFTGHPKVEKNEATGAWVGQVLMTGQLREKIPLLFSDILLSDATSDSQTGRVAYSLRTTPTRTFKTIRSSFRGLSEDGKVTVLEPSEDVTIDFTQPLEGQGLGGIVQWERRYLQSIK